jgi:hypothetical protein
MDTCTTFSVPTRHCPSEERLIRLALATVDGADQLAFDLEGRILVVVHSDGLEDQVLGHLEPLGLGARQTEGRRVDAPDVGAPDPDAKTAEAHVLWLLLGINAAMFLVEVVLGY